MPSCSHNIKPRCLIRSSNSCKYTIPTYHLRTSMQDTLRIAFLAMRCNVHSIGIASQQGITMTLHCVRFPCNAQHSIAVNELSCPQMPLRLHNLQGLPLYLFVPFIAPGSTTEHDMTRAPIIVHLQCMIFHCTVMGTPTVFACANYSITASLCITSRLQDITWHHPSPHSIALCCKGDVW